MAEITAAAVKALRERTDLPMMKCKQALIEAGGDEQKAIKILQSQVGRLLKDRGANATSEGRIYQIVKEDGSEAVMVEVQCESAPVAGSETLAKLGSQLAKQALGGTGAATPEALLSQPAPEGKGTLNDLYEETINKIREKIVVARVKKLDGPVAGYVHHDGKVAVLFQAEGAKPNMSVMRDVAMHIAALKPKAVTPEQLDPQTVKAERDRLSAEAKATGKPDNIIEKIVDGQMKKFYEQQGVLIYQPFAKDDTKTVSQALAESGLKPKDFTLWVLGIPSDK